MLEQQIVRGERHALGLSNWYPHAKSKFAASPHLIHENARSKSAWADSEKINRPKSYLVATTHYTRNMDYCLTFIFGVDVISSIVRTMDALFRDASLAVPYG